MRTSRAQPNDPHARVLLSEAGRLASEGRLAEADTVYRGLTETRPECAAAWHGLGQMAFQSGDFGRASQCIARAVLLDPEVATYQRILCEVLRRLGRLDEAISSGLIASQLAPKDASTLYHLGLAYSDSKMYAKAIRCYRKAVRLDAGDGPSWNNLGAALEQEGDAAGAKKAYARAVALNPLHAEAQNNLGAIHLSEGCLNEASSCFGAALAVREQFVEAHYNLSALKTYTGHDPHVQALEALWAKRTALPQDARVRCAFALGKALEDIGDYDRAFSAYDEGNRIQQQAMPIDEARADDLLAHVLETFDEKFFDSRRGWKGVEDVRTPIFIVGMPRSGTTLLEQILCSHASVYGAGEITALDEAITAARGRSSLNLRSTSFDKKQIHAVGAEYLARAWEHAPQSAFITDKMSTNFFHLGLIHLALPHAKIIHVQRDPMDSCFSLFARLFDKTMEFAYDQGTVGRYYVRYRRLMDHWRHTLPAGRILDLSYERLVADTEREARRVLEFVGLPWDANCLDFHRNARVVRTASVAQVRKPIYTSSVGRWKHFAGHLAPLYAIVGSYRPADELVEDVSPGAVAASALLPGDRSAQAWHSEGVEHYKHARLSMALQCYDRALELEPRFALALNSKGFLLQESGSLEEARTCLEAAVQIAPEMAMARLNLGMLQLKLGDWERGWENYEARWSGSAESQGGMLNRLVCPLPQWNGESDTDGLRLLVITEQGFGDTFQFSRYLALAAKRFARVGFACSPPTLRLMEGAFGEDVCFFTRMPAHFDDWDLQCPLMSLPRAFGTRMESVPNEVPYLKARTGARQYWRERLERVTPGGFRVGIAWAGRRTHQNDQRRSLGLDQIGPLLADTRITWVSLQKWAPEDPPLSAPFALHWLDWTGELHDFADTAALVANLDLVISIDSAMVHLAGGLGLPVWMLNRYDNEWRWLTERQDSPWYPGLRIFNQTTSGEWSSPIEAVRIALAALPISDPRPHKARHGPIPSRSTPRTLASDQLPAGGLNIERAMEFAVQHQSAGRLREADELLQRIVASEPLHAHALHLLGVVAHQTGRHALGIELVARACALRGDVALFQSNLAEMHRQSGQVREAIFHGQRAVQLDPSMASAQSNLGIALHDGHQDEAAEAAHQKALELNPNLVQSLNNLGSIERRRKNSDGAVRWYRKALRAAPDYIDTLSNLAAVLVEAEQPEEAVPLLEKALDLRPDYPEALCNLGLARLQMGQAADAAALLCHALALRRAYPQALVGLAVARREMDDPLASLALLNEANSIAPEMASAHLQRGAILADLGQSAAAEGAYQRALEIEPASADALVGLSNLRMETGAVEEGEALLRQALVLEPDNIGACFQSVQARTVRRGDPVLLALENRAQGIEQLTLGQRIPVHYALGKAYEDMGEYDAAFVQFLEGARCNRSKLDYDVQAEEARALQITKIVDQDFVRRFKGAGNSSDAPIFVLGMPRSGTTLTEQIIASHPKVFGAGELGDLLALVQSSPMEGERCPFPENLGSLTDETLTTWGNRYAVALRQRAPQALRITDKMPANYLALGLIPLILPNARIIHVKRDPLDTCVSCFTRLFNLPQPATYSLSEMGRHYASYQRLMAHWRALMPGGFLEVEYEEIVADIDGRARRIIDFCGLPWDDACLDFFNNRRRVRTASVLQVRKPLYSSSIGRWRRYEKFLDPLFESLGEFSPAR